MPERNAGRRGGSAVMNRLADPPVALLLRSPFHRLLSGSTLLITVTGRRSGTRYTTPVNYFREGSRLTVFSRRGRTWWRNLRGGGPVLVRLQGRDIVGRGEVVPASEQEVAAALRTARPVLSP